MAQGYPDRLDLAARLARLSDVETPPRTTGVRGIALGA
jgi:hypothetical protein